MQTVAFCAHKYIFTHSDLTLTADKRLTISNEKFKTIKIHKLYACFELFQNIFYLCAYIARLTVT